MKKNKYTKNTNLLVFTSVTMLLIFLSGCTQQRTPSGTSGSYTISIQNFAFNPGTLTVPNGTTVTWINNDNVDHTVTTEGGLFNSGPLNNGQNFTYTFTTPGTYNYSCSIHPYMKGIIIVQ